MEKILNPFSQEFYDRTVQEKINQLQNENQEQKDELEKQKIELTKQKVVLEEKDKLISKYLKRFGHLLDD